MADMSKINFNIDGVNNEFDIKDKVAREEIAINNSTLGISSYYCKNLFDYDTWKSSVLKQTTPISNGTCEFVDNGITITSTTTESSAYTNPYTTTQGNLYKIPVQPNTKYIISWEADNDNNGYVYVFRNGILTGNGGIGKDNANMKEFPFTTHSDTTFITIRLGVHATGNTSITYSNIMIRKADIIDPTYEPYKPSVNERLTVNENDILSAKNEIAINRNTLGTQCVNIFDGNLRQGGIQSTDGIFYVADDTVASNNFIKVSKNATISISRTASSGYLVWCFYDKDKNYIGYGSEENVQIISGGSGFHIPSGNSKFACFKLVNPNITYAKFVDLTNSLTNTYTIVEGEYTEDTMPAYEPYKPNIDTRLTQAENDINTNKSDILKVQRHSAAMGMHSQGWYRIAECVIGQGRSAILRLERTYGFNPTEIITILINVAYNVATVPFFDCNILDKYVQNSLLKTLRIVIPTELSLSSKMYIDVWNDGTSANGLKTTIFGESVLSSSIEPITILNPTISPELTDEYTTKEFDLTEGDVFDRIKKQKENDDILRNLIKLLNNGISYPVTTNGSFTASGPTEDISNRIRTDIIPVKAGDVIEIVNGSLVHGCGIWKGEVKFANNIRNDNGPTNTNENVIIEYDGNIVITFLHTNQKDLSLKDFDGSVTLYRKST